MGCAIRNTHVSQIIGFEVVLAFFTHHASCRTEQTQGGLHRRSTFPFPPFLDTCYRSSYCLTYFGFRTPQVIGSPESCGACSGYKSLRCIRTPLGGPCLMTIACCLPRSLALRYSKMLPLRRCHSSCPYDSCSQRSRTAPSAAGIRARRIGCRRRIDG
jgi:hypothetical protein